MCSKEQHAVAGRRVLIVEDEPLVALEFRSVLEDAGAEVVGVATTLREAETFVAENLAAAVLDVNLNGEMIYPIAERLLALGVTIVFATGYQTQSVVPKHLRQVPTLQKPVNSSALVRLLSQMIRESATP